MTLTAPQRETARRPLREAEHHVAPIDPLSPLSHLSPGLEPADARAGGQEDMFTDVALDLLTAQKAQGDAS